MSKKTMIEMPQKKPAENSTEAERPMDLEDPFVQDEENPDNIPADDLFENPPYEPPVPGEGP